MTHTTHHRRQFITQSLALGSLGVLSGSAWLARSAQARPHSIGAAPATTSTPTATEAPEAPERSLSFMHSHTGERRQVVYAQAGQYLPQGLASLNHLLRDHYSHQVGQIDPLLFDLLHGVQRSLATHRAEFEVISGYRAPATNARLRRTGGGGVAKNSLHMQGRAIDVRLAGVPLAELRDAALAQRGGGVGFYPRDGFVHIDTGAVRHWGWSA